MQEPHGDRRTEMVLIGRDMDKAALTALFDTALLTDEEFALSPEAWRNLPDPFPQWLPNEPQAHEHT
jgi:hypothetical protein